MSRAFTDARLTIDLDALVANWRWLAARAAPARCGAAVKADGYGLGARAVAAALARAGCTDFFVAHAAEGVALRGAVPDAAIFVLHGPGAQEALLRAYRLVPALSTLDQVARWRDSGGGAAVLQLDTGMNRLGLEAGDVATLAAEPARLDGIELALVMSHLACADEPDHPMNAAQKAAFDRLRALLPAAPASLANSAGLLLGPGYVYDVVRPGIGLYGADPLSDGAAAAPRNLAQVIHLEARILQVRHVDGGATVGYGATHRAAGPARIATVPVGYADGFLRAFSNNFTARIGGHAAPLVGRVSMDLITLDVSAVPPALAHEGAWVDLLGGPSDLREAARRAGTIEYELLTRLGNRLPRHYRGGRA
jgi:alanine racemase